MTQVVGGKKPAPLSESDYGTIYQVTLATGQVREFQVPPAPVPATSKVERGR